MTLIQSLHKQCKGDRKPFPLIVLQEMFSLCFLMSFKPHRKLPLLFPSFFLPFLAPYRISAASALIVVFIFWYCIKWSFSLVITRSSMLFSTSSCLRKLFVFSLKCVQFLHSFIHVRLALSNIVTLKEVKVVLLGNLTEKSSHTLIPSTK